MVKRDIKEFKEFREFKEFKTYAYALKTPLKTLSLPLSPDN